MHELGLAFDLWINDETQLADLGQVWEQQMGGVWGGHFKDPIHFEAGGDLSDYTATTEALAAPPQAESTSFDTTLAVLRTIPLEPYAEALAKMLGIDPESMRRRGF